MMETKGDKIIITQAQAQYLHDKLGHWLELGEEYFTITLSELENVDDVEPDLVMEARMRCPKCGKELESKYGRCGEEHLVCPDKCMEYCTLLGEWDDDNN